MSCFSGLFSPGGASASSGEQIEVFACSAVSGEELARVLASPEGSLGSMRHLIRRAASLQSGLRLLFGGAELQDQTSTANCGFAAKAEVSVVLEFKS